MKQKFTLCPFAWHILIAGLILPAVFCLTYIWGLASGRIETAFTYDIVRLAAETAKIYLSCAVVALFGAFVSELAHKRA